MFDLLQRPRTGRDLRLLRVAFDVTQRDIARTWGVTRQRVTSVEAARRPTERVTGRYLAALAALVAQDRET